MIDAARAVRVDSLFGKAKRAPFPLIAAALRRQANELVLSFQGAEQTGITLNLTKAVLDQRLAELRDEAALIGEAYRIISGLAPLEQSVRAMLDAA